MDKDKENISLIRNEDLQVKIINLKPMYVASFHVISQSPEQEVLERLINWAEPKGLLNDPEKYPIFGFDNPTPSESKKEYGYECWIRIDDEFIPAKEITVKKFDGGKFATTRCEIKGDIEIISQTWQKLADWVKNNNYSCGGTHWLEKHIKLYDPNDSIVNFIIDLYFPIR